MDLIVKKHLKNHQKNELDFHLIKQMELPLKKLKKHEFLLEGNFKYPKCTSNDLK